MSKTYYLEWCEKWNQRDGTFLPQDLVTSRTGFRSVFGFETQPISSKGLAQYPVYSDTLFVDFDDGLESPGYLKLITILTYNEFNFKSYASGSKGVHVHVQIEPMYGLAVPYSQKVFMQGLDVGCDLSIYRPSSLIRLPGTVHDKTGKRKEQINEGQGIDLLRIEQKELATFTQVEVNDENLFYVAMTRTAGLINNEPPTGTRSLTLWSLTKNLANAGISFETSLEIAYTVNASWRNPKPESEVLRSVKQAYNQ